MSEVERKYQLKFVPGDLQDLPVDLIEQGYLFDFDAEMRLRRLQKPGGDLNFYLTVKDNEYLEREEWEQEIPDWVFNSTWKYVRNSLRKMRVTPPTNAMGIKYEVDIYLDKLDGLVILECEYQSREMLDDSYIPLPLWAVNAREVTFDFRYKNKNLAKATEEEVAELLRW